MEFEVIHLPILSVLLLSGGRQIAPFLVRYITRYTKVIGIQAARGLLIVPMMEATSTCETSVNFYQTTRCKNPKGSYLHTCCPENLKYQSYN
jgi:hypothetical protein